MGKGRPSIYSKELEDSIIDLIESGLSERKIAQMDGMPSIRTIHRWKDEKPEFCLHAKHARAASADIYNDRRMEKSDKLYEEALKRLETGEPFPKGVVEAIRASMQEDAREAAQRDDSRYGDRKRVALTGGDGGAVKVTTSPDLSGVDLEKLKAVREMLYGSTSDTR